MSTSVGPAPGPAVHKSWVSGRAVGTVIAFILVAAGAAAIAVVVTKDHDKSSGGAASLRSAARTTGVSLQNGKPELMSASAVRAFARAATGPIYWAGPGHTTGRLEVTTTKPGNVFIRYLTGSAVAGDPHARFLTVGTYGLTNAYSVLEADRKKPGRSAVHVPGGGIAVTSKSAPKSYYVAFPGTDYVGEVYDPSPTHARKLVLSGAIGPVR